MTAEAPDRHAPLAPLTREQILVTIGIMAAIAVAALDATVVGTAMPTIIGQLGGLGEYAWVFSAYLLASTTTVPLYARLADVHGRKPIFLFGLALFVGGSALCGLSTNMLELIAFRTLQGLGAGAVQPISFTIAGDIFEPRRRARMQGYFSGVWGASAIVGPAIGGIITSTIGWPWVFELNIPVGLIAGLIVWRGLHERFERRSHRLDWPGAILLSGSIVALLLAVTEGNQLFGWLSPITIGLVVAAVALGVGFVYLARRNPEPLIDLELPRAPVIRAGLVIGTLAGVVMFGLTTYVPPMVQGVHGGTPLDAGIAVAAMSIGWPVGSIVAGRLLLRLRARPIVLVGGVLLVVGTLLITQLDRFPALAYAMLGAGITGLGMGLMSTTLLVIIQGAVAWQRRAVATGLVQFSRTIGGAVGVGVMGGILVGFVGGASSAILDPVARAILPTSELVADRAALASGLGVIYLLLVVAAVATLLLAIRTMPDVSLGHEIDQRR
ncbi:MAG TPA: MFS transporter [Candidatus Limnocylindrales bacterium]|nr:MFS transporter [Candidatus Limnocylindrales bacterium]